MKPLVLIVEDEAPLVTLLRYNLEQEGFDVAEVMTEQLANRLHRLGDAARDVAGGTVFRADGLGRWEVADEVPEEGDVSLALRAVERLLSQLFGRQPLELLDTGDVGHGTAA